MRHAIAISARPPLPEAPYEQDGLELTILMPCLNEAETLATCIDNAVGFLRRTGISGEVLISDNGSSDGSIEIAKRHGARVVHAQISGYGAALRHGIENAKSQFIIIGDADNSYNFNALDDYVTGLRAGADLVMGNRFKGGIYPGAMPLLHRYLGNPVLSFLGRLFFASKVGDFHCGLRGFRRDSILALGLKTDGMEFASEMVVRASLHGLRITEVPTTLSPDGRSRRPHLRTWRDGWRHLRFLLLLCPRWLFFYPGIAILLFGFGTGALLLPGPVAFSSNITLDVHSLIVACLAILVGSQCLSFWIIARLYTAARGLLPGRPHLEFFKKRVTLERALMFGSSVATTGIGGVLYCFIVWAGVDFGPLEYGWILRVLIMSSTLVALGLQIVFAAFLSAIFDAS